MKKFFHEFKEFALKGNMISIAVGLLIGAAFQGLIQSFTDNIISPVIGLFVSQNFDYLELHLFGVTLRYGAFITSLINFIILALVVFLIIRVMNKIINHNKNEDKSATRTCPFCMTDIHINATRCSACTSEIL